MRKTKKELVTVIRDLERYQQENDRIREELARTEAALAEARAKAGRMKAEAQTAESENQRLESELADLRDELAETEKRLTDEADQYRTGYELFKQFVDEGDQVTVLIDASYTIRYVNQAAAAQFVLPSPYAIVGRRIFDFFSYKDAAQLKKKVDAAFLQGTAEKIKDLRFQNLKGSFFKIRIRLSRVRYEDRPCIKMDIR
jgi:PAS domain-containing protein